MVGVDVGGETGDLVVVGDVQGSMLGHDAAQRAGVGDRRLESLGVAVGQIELGPVGSQLQRGRAPDPTGSAGEKTPLALKSGTEATVRSVLLCHSGDTTFGASRT